MKSLLSVLLLVLVPAIALPQTGQQKKKTGAAQSAQKTAQRVVEKQPEKYPGTMHEILVKYEGLSTNLGKLVKVRQDFVVFEKDDVSLFVAIGAIISIQEIPPDEDDEAPAKTLKIRLADID